MSVVTRCFVARFAKSRQIFCRRITPSQIMIRASIRGVKQRATCTTRTTGPFRARLLNSRGRERSGLVLVSAVAAVLAALLQESSEFGQSGSGQAKCGNGQLLGLGDHRRGVLPGILCIGNWLTGVRRPLLQLVVVLSRTAAGRRRVGWGDLCGGRGRGLRRCRSAAAGLLAAASRSSNPMMGPFICSCQVGGRNSESDCSPRGPASGVSRTCPEPGSLAGVPSFTGPPSGVAFTIPAGVG